MNKDFKKKFNEKFETDFDKFIPKDYFKVEKSWKLSEIFFQFIGLFLIFFSSILIMGNFNYNFQLFKISFIINYNLLNNLFVMGTIFFSVSFVLLSMRANAYSSVKLSFLSPNIEKYNSSLDNRVSKINSEIKKSLKNEIEEIFENLETLINKETNKKIKEKRIKVFKKFESKILKNRENNQDYLNLLRKMKVKIKAISK